MAYYVRMMRQEDVSQVTETDREAFATQWPPPNYKRELQSELSHYIVVCDDSQVAPDSEAKEETPQSEDVISRIRRWFGRDGTPAPAPVKTELVIGFAGLWVIADEAHIISIAVREKFRRQGAGELLIIALIELSARLKAQTITLEARISNTAAQSLYAKFGFVRVGVRRGYYTDNREDAVLMTTDNIGSAAFQARFAELKQQHSQKWGEVCSQISG